MTTEQTELKHKGFILIPSVFSTEEIGALSTLITAGEASLSSPNRSAELFAIRSFMQTIPGAGKIIWSTKLLEIAKTFFGADYFVVKSIYFDKPSLSNWFVSWHQDLIISVDKRSDNPGFIHWTEKQGQVGVQPPVAVLQSMYTIRIHLDDCDASNGALRVIPGSHNQGVVRPETLPQPVAENVSEVKAGGVMIMRPLLMHSSRRSTSEKQRRVIHMELTNMDLPDGMQWAERK
jgi:ectoine hydroxylase-related dioxygenase (phytanoyl-CoA dioxygenase family)